MKKYTIAAFLFVCNISLAQSPPANPSVNPAVNPSENPTTPLVSNPVARPSASEPKTPEQIAKRLLQEDKNGDGKLSQDELPQQLRQAFEAMDTNHDGLLDESEVLAFSKMMASRESSRESSRGSGGGAQNFEGAMKQTNRGFKALEKSTFDPAGKAQDLASIQMVQSGLLAAKGMISTVKMAPQAKEKYGTDTAKFESDMRSQLLATLTLSIALENAVIRGDAAGAKELVSKLDAEEEEGHEMFRPQENEEKGEKSEPAPATSTAPKAPTAPTVPTAPTNSPK